MLFASRPTGQEALDMELSLLAQQRVECLFPFTPTLSIDKWRWGCRQDISHCFGSVTIASVCRKLSVRSFGKSRLTSQSKTTHWSTHSDYSLSEKLSIVLVSRDHVNVSPCCLSSRWISRLPRKKTQIHDTAEQTHIFEQLSLEVEPGLM